jgi:hypothetical protein
MADESKLATFLNSNKLNAKRLLAVSHKLETLQIDDRRLKLAKKQAKKEGADDAKKEAATGKPRSGRAVTSRALDSALKGGTISAPTKQRILRAVNYILEQKKKDKVDLRQLF